MNNMSRFSIVAFVSIVLMLSISCSAQTTTQAPATTPVTQKEVELKYDDGTAETVAFAGPEGGHLIHFISPASSLFINKVKIYGRLFGTCSEERQFELQVWDKNGKSVWSNKYPYALFPKGGPGPDLKGIAWVEIEIPKVEVGDDFYIHVYTSSSLPTSSVGGLGIGVDKSISNKNSDGTSSYEINWPYPFPKDDINWMIRVVGTYLVP